jgi:tripartite-type tricarboxylate transporter receptor subunit TctC
MKAMNGALSVLALAICVGGSGGTARADAVEEFYRGKTLDLIIPTSPGGDYDIRGRMVSRHLGRFIPGNPTIVARNMPGGVGIQAANYIMKAAPKDGTVLHIIFQTMPSYQAMGGQAVEFDVRKFGWIGNTTDSPNVLNSWHTTGIKTIQDAMERELVVGSPGTATSSYIYPSVMNALVGTKFKIVAGYPGGNDVNLAMEKGEVGGRGSNSWASWKSGHPHWIAEKKIHILVQVALKRAPDLPDPPLMHELAKNDDDRAVLRFISADMGISRAFVTTPDVPADRLAALRKAFSDMMKDEQFLAEAERAKMDISASDGAAVQAVAQSMIDTPAPILARAKALIETPGK